MASTTTASPATRKFVKNFDIGAIFVLRHALALFLIFYGVWVGLPFLAPIFMHYGLTGPANALYFLYSFFCHQLPERSIFFFGPQPMYSLEQIGQVWSTESQLVLRQFVGTPEMGWKMAWSDRMISTYGGLWIGGLLYSLLRKRVPRISLAAWIAFGIMPLGLDGFTHMINDVVAGSSGLGFRDTNEWLRVITSSAFPDSFYYGNMFGSFNSWARWITGLLFGITTVFAIFPIVGQALKETRRDLEYQLARVRMAEGR